jgi:cell wall assembly regulator SMI1
MMCELAPLLNPDMLTSYEALLRAQGVPVDAWTRDGLTAKEMEKTLAPLGLHLPIEGRVLWAWHDGATREGHGGLFGRGNRFLSLANAVRQYRQSREVAENTVDKNIPPFDDPDFRWNPSWLPFTGDPGHPVAIDCSVAEGDPTPVRCICWSDQPEEYAQIGARSLGEVVILWTKALELGVWRWNAERELWDVDRDLLDPELRDNPLM